MNKLVISVSAITPDGVPINVAVSEPEVRPPDVDTLSAEDIRVWGLLSQVSSEYIFEGTVSGRFAHACDRCLEPAQHPFSVEVLWAFREGLPSEAAGDETAEDSDGEAASVAGIAGNEINLASQIWEELVLAAPAKVLCREDCAGLCPQCGADLNRGTCSCREDGPMENKGLAGLADMFPEVRSKRSED